MEHAFQEHIQRLLQTGIATHIVENNVAVDPIFALSKARDFPQVKFAAAFEDGTVVLGCPDQLPEPLKGAARPIARVDTPAPHGIETKLDALIADLADRQHTDQRDNALEARLDKLLSAVDQQMSVSAALENRLDGVEAMLEGGLRDITGRLNDTSKAEALQNKLASLISNAQTEHDFSPIIEQMSDLRSTVGAALTPLAAQACIPTIETIETSLADFEERLMARAQMAQVNHATAPQLDDIGAAQQVTEQVLTTLSNDVKSLIAMHGATTSRDNTTELLMALEQTPALSRLDDMLKSISADMRTLTDTNAPASASAQDQMMAKISGLTDAVTAISQRPDPVIDLTEQRQGLARFQTAMSAVLTRMESAIADLAGLKGQPHAHSEADELHTKIDRLTDKVAPIDRLSTQLADLTTELSILPQQGERLESQLKGMEMRLDPVAHDAAQRRLLAHFTNAIKVIVSRLDTVAEARATKDSDVLPLLQRLDSALASAPQKLQLEMMMETVAEQHREMRALHGELRAYLERPMPALDLTAQRTSFAQFATALKTVVTRFERIADQIEPFAHPSDAPGEASQPEPAPEPVMASFTDSRISLDALRLDFAELIARQIRDNTLSAPQAAEATTNSTR